MIPEYPIPNDDLLNQMRGIYQVGCRVELVYMDDEQAPPIGTLGTVIGVDAVATILVDWDNGSTLGIAYGADVCRIV